MIHLLRVSMMLVPQLAPAAPVAGRVHLGTDLTLANHYVWRGVTRANEPVFQPAAYAALSWGVAFITAGVWSSLELGRADADDLSDVGAGRRGRTETNIWVEYSQALGALTAHAGWTAYVFRDDASPGGRGPAYDTHEVYARLESPGLPLHPSITGYLDLDRVGGTYLESAMTLPVPVNPAGIPFGSIFVRAVAGWSLGQEVGSADDAERGYFATAGLTHVDIAPSVTLGFTIFRVATAVHAAWHVQINRDARTRRTSANPLDSDKDTHQWLGVTLSVMYGR